MARAIVTIQIMPDSPGEDLKQLEQQGLAAVEKFAGKGETKVVVEPVAFGLSALKITFIMDENIGSTEPLEQAIEKIKGVASVTVTDVRRTIG
ncbi:elongation factor 1-beta [Candidatus Woesearchaeota archaeon]|nr:elongation factor 1-beta [Candidatus Woesearchaeota archaeon]